MINNTSQFSKRRIARNTILLYLRQLLVMLIGLFSVRIVLSVLGVVDYGIYTVVGGAASMFSFFVGAMAASTQRFFSYMIGREDNLGLVKVFNITFVIYVIISIVVIILSETIGLWFLCNKLNIPLERFQASLWIFQIAIISTLCNIMAAPYVSVIIAHEQMGVYAKISIIEAILKVAVVFTLLIGDIDKLVLYGILQLLSSVLITSIYIHYCRKYYVECNLQIRRVWDKSMFMEIANFSTWNLFGNIAGIVKNQGLAFLLNIFFGPALNTSQNIANQVKNYSSTFFQNFSTAVKPQVIKTYACEEYDKMFSLVFQSCKFTYFLMLIVLLPLIFNLDYILYIWLGDVPQYVSIFTKLLLFETLIDSFSAPMSAANQATGKIKLYQFAISMATILNLPFSYIILKLGYEVQYVFWTSIFFQCIISLIRMLFLRRIRRDCLSICLKITFKPCFIVSIISFAICWLLFDTTITLPTFLINLPLQVVIILFIIGTLGLTAHERKFILDLVRKKIKK